MSKRLQRRLFRIYSFGAKFGFALRQRVSRLGGLLLCLTPLVGIASVMYPRASFFMLCGILMASIIVAYLSLFFRRAHVRVERHLPTYATAGEALEYTVVCENLSTLPLNNYFIVEYAPDPRPSRELFLNSTEPGEQLRNSFDQTFLAYRWMWMLRRRLLLKSYPSLGVRLKSGESQWVTLSLKPLRRGVIHLERMHAILPDPLGLFQKVKRLQQETDILIVLPKRYAIGLIRFDGSARSQLGGDANSSTVGQSGEFVSLREYRPGDPPKHIHWPSWGKTGKPIVKEYEEVFFPRYGLVLDTAVNAEDEVVFEEAISVAATFASAVDTEKSLLDLMFVQQGAQLHTIGKNVERVDKMLEVLASIEMQADPDWDGLVRMVMRHSDELTTCVVVLCSWDEERKVLIEKLSSIGVQLCVLMVNDPQSEKLQEVSDCPVDLHYLSVGQIEAGLSALSEI